MTTSFDSPGDLADQPLELEIVELTLPIEDSSIPLFFGLRGRLQSDKRKASEWTNTAIVVSTASCRK